MGAAPLLALSLEGRFSRVRVFHCVLPTNANRHLFVGAQHRCALSSLFLGFLAQVYSASAISVQLWLGHSRSLHARNSGWQIQWGSPPRFLRGADEYRPIAARTC